jgi:TPP-dependent 2-oxoacid decarboxylase
MRKIIDGLAVASFVLVLGTLGGGFFGYKYLTSPQGQAKIKNAIMGDIGKVLPSAIGDQLPKATGPALPFK